MKNFENFLSPTFCFTFFGACFTAGISEMLSHVLDFICAGSLLLLFIIARGDTNTTWKYTK